MHSNLSLSQNLALFVCPSPSTRSSCGPVTKSPLFQASDLNSPDMKTRPLTPLTLPRLLSRRGCDTEATTETSKAHPFSIRLHTTVPFSLSIDTSLLPLHGIFRPLASKWRRDPPDPNSAQRESMVVRKWARERYFKCFNARKFWGTQNSESRTHVRTIFSKINRRWGLREWLDRRR